MDKVDHTTTMPNPFFYGGRITNGDFFVGRRTELRKIFAALETAHTGQIQSYSVVGPRRIGKSSLLYRVTQIYRQHLRPADGYRVAYVDATDPRCVTQAGLLDTMLDELHVAHKPPVTLADFTATIEQLNARSHSRIWPVVCLDEFEQLTKNRGEFPDAFFDGLRSLMNASHIAFVIASQTSLAQLSRDDKLTSPFFNIFTQLELGELAESEADELTDRGFTSDHPFPPAERQWMRRIGGKHPMKLQIAGKLLYEAKASGQAINWRALERENRQQVEFVFGKQPAKWHGWLAHVMKWLQRILWSPRHLGRAILDLLGRGDKASDSSAWLIGVALIVALLTVFSGIIGVDTLREGFQVLTGTKK